MYVRLAFSVAAHLEPEILLVDEVLAVGDAEFQRRCLGRMEEIGGTGRTVLFVSHNMQAVAQLCDRVILLENGRHRSRRAEHRGGRAVPADGSRLDLRAGVAGRRDGSGRRPGEYPSSAASSTRTARARTQSTSAGPWESRSGSRFCDRASRSSRRSSCSTAKGTLRSTRWTRARVGAKRGRPATTSPRPGFRATS